VPTVATGHSYLNEVGSAACEDAPVELDADAVLLTEPADRLEGRDLLVGLHGLGATEQDLFSLRPMLPTGLALASLRAPVRRGAGWSWWTVDPGSEEQHGADEGARAVLARLDALPPVRSVRLVGFSQGGATALQLLRLAPERFVRTAVLAGFVATRAHPGDERVAAVRPEVFWGRGDLDTVIPAEAVAETERWLFAHTRLKARVYAGLGHSVSIEEVADAAAFLAPPAEA
jgi:phospholipase/carboxylesterase